MTTKPPNLPSEESATKLLNREPTEKMIDAAQVVWPRINPAFVWRTMWDSAPSAPSVDVERETRRALIIEMAGAWKGSKKGFIPLPEDLLERLGRVLFPHEKDMTFRAVINDLLWEAKQPVGSVPPHPEPDYSDEISDEQHAAIRALVTPELPGEVADLDAVAEAIHLARWKPEDARQRIPLAEEDASGREYCYRLARAALLTRLAGDKCEREAELASILDAAVRGLRFYDAGNGIYRSIIADAEAALQNERKIP